MKGLSTCSSITCLGCTKGIDMCKTRPCWGTPDDAMNIIGAGYIDLLALDRWVADEEYPYTVLMLQPAILGCESSVNQLTYAPELKAMKPVRCTFLNDKDLCEVHDIKPLEGAMSCCKLPSSHYHIQVVRTWNTELGRTVMKMWCDKKGIEINKLKREDFLEIISSRPYTVI